MAGVVSGGDSGPADVDRAIAAMTRLHDLVAGPGEELTVADLLAELEEKPAWWRAAHAAELDAIDALVDV